MARVGVSITKSTAFRNSTQEFSNVYYYTDSGGTPSVSDADALIDALVTFEKPIHGTNVTFVRGRCWTQGGSPGTNNMISQKTLSGTGARSSVTSFDKERAFLFRLRAGNDSRGNPVYLRKWFHACGSLYAGQTVQSAWLDQTSAFGTTEENAMNLIIDPVKNISAAGRTWSLCSKSGRNFDSGQGFKSHKYLEHHQLGDQWRAT